MSFLKKSYIDRNYNSPNPLRRLAHRTRFKISVSSITSDSPFSLIDYGCGDGLFLNQINERNISSRLIGFEPFMESITNNQVRIVSEWDQIDEMAKDESGFNYVTCFEVLEHFSPENQFVALKRMHSVVKKDGKVIISVPIERGFPALVKNLLRRINMPKSTHVFTWKNIWNSLISNSLLHLRQDSGYMTHMGFYFTDLEDEIDKLFTILDKSYSPIGGPTFHINSQVFYTLKKK